MTTNTVADIPDDELLRRAVSQARPIYKGGRQPKWAAVMDVFMLGSTYAHQLCRRFNIDPDQQVKK